MGLTRHAPSPPTASDLPNLMDETHSTYLARWVDRCMADALASWWVVPGRRPTDARAASSLACLAVVPSVCNHGRDRDGRPACVPAHRLIPFLALWVRPLELVPTAVRPDGGRGRMGAESDRP